LNRRRLRARTEDFSIANIDSRFPIFSNFRVQSGSGMTYSVEIRDVRQRQFACDCVDFRINSLGTCKHVEAVLWHLEGRFKRLFRAAASNGTVPDPATGAIRLHKNGGALPRQLKRWFDEDGTLRECSPEESLEALRQLAAEDLPDLRLSQELAAWVEQRRRTAERKQLRPEYEQRVQSAPFWKDALQPLREFAGDPARPCHPTLAALMPFASESMASA
jgi:hypothetical protein